MSDLIKESNETVFKWPQPKFVPMGQSGSQLNPERVRAANDLIRQELILGEQIALVEMLGVAEYMQPQGSEARVSLLEAAIAFSRTIDDHHDRLAFLTEFEDTDFDESEWQDWVDFRADFFAARFPNIEGVEA